MKGKLPIKRVLKPKAICVIRPQPALALNYSKRSTPVPMKPQVQSRATEQGYR